MIRRQVACDCAVSLSGVLNLFYIVRKELTKAFEMFIYVFWEDRVNAHENLHH